MLVCGMNILARASSLSGHITVPGSKSHTIRALLLASLAEGTSRIANPLPSADCLSTAAAVPLIGAQVSFGSTKQDGQGTVWTVQGAGKSVHLPSDVVNVGNSGSLLYFLSPLAATFPGWSIFTGDESIRRRPVHHVVDVLCQLGAEAACAVPGSKTCPLVIKGPVQGNRTVRTDGAVSSQYISGLMLAALRLPGTLNIELSDPKETPYLVMTQKWLERMGSAVQISPDFKRISVSGPVPIQAFDCTVPSDWEAVAFPLVAAILTDSEVVIEHVDGSGTQGDDMIVSVLQQLCADIEWNVAAETLTVRGGKRSRDGVGRLTTENFEHGELHINLSGFPDAVCALAVAACFTEGTVFIEDIAVCRRKETDRIAVLAAELSKLGADVAEGSDFLVVHGHSPRTANGKPNPAFSLHGAQVESWRDHRVAMALACLGLGLPEGEAVVVRDADCCAVSFPRFFDEMRSLNADFSEA